MNAGEFRTALGERRVLVGSWIQANSPTVAEVLADAGFDWIGVDMEHTEIGIESLAALLRAMRGRGTNPIVRVPTNDVMDIRRALDAGAGGVLVPLTSTAEQARGAVRAAKYPPAGVRGFAFCRANGWGADFQDYAARADAETAVIVMIETREGVENIDAILEVDGVDGVFIGPYDLSGSYGIPGQTSHPLVREACARVADACGRHDRSAGLHVVIPDDEAIRNAIDDGFNLVCLGVDVVFVRRGAAAALASARKLKETR